MGVKMKPPPGDVDQFCLFIKSSSIFHAPDFKLKLEIMPGGLLFVLFLSCRWHPEKLQNFVLTAGEEREQPVSSLAVII